MVRLLATAAKLIEPSGEYRVGGGFDIDKFEPHADARLDDADRGERFNEFTLTFKSDASAGLHCEWLACTHKTAAKRDVRCYAFRAAAGFKVEDLSISCKWVTNGVTAVAEAYFLRHTIGVSVVHGDNVAHCPLGGGRRVRALRKYVPLCLIRVPEMSKKWRNYGREKAKEAIDGPICGYCDACDANVQE